MKSVPARMAGIDVGIQIRRNADHQFLKDLGQSQPYRRIPITMRFSEFEDGFQLSAEDQDGISVAIRLEWEKTPARDEARAYATLERQLTRLGTSEFICNGFEVEFSQVYFLPVSVLNALRRDLVAALLTERARNFPRREVEIYPNNIPYPENELTFLGNVLNHKAEVFFRRHGVDVIELAAESGLELAGRKVMITKYCIKYELGGCPHQIHPVGFDEPLYLVDENGLRLRLIFNCQDCLMEIYWPSDNTMDDG